MRDWQTDRRRFAQLLSETEALDEEETRLLRETIKLEALGCKAEADVTWNKLKEVRCQINEILYRYRDPKNRAS